MTSELAFECFVMTPKWAWPHAKSFPGALQQEGKISLYTYKVFDIIVRVVEDIIFGRIYVP